MAGMIRTFSLIVCLVVSCINLISCSGRRPAERPVYLPPMMREPQAEAKPVEDAVEDTIEDTVVVAAPPVPVVSNYRVIPFDSRRPDEPASSFDILNTQLNLSFDFEREQVIGTAIHRLSPTVDALSRLHFDARDMEIRSVSVRRPNTNFVTTAYQYNNQDLEIPLEPPAGRTVALEVRIEYVANPTRNGRNLGLVFVDPREEDPSRPTQIWTLGQPEDNQYWFPSWDYPNDRMTFELALTVPERFSTVANGDLVEQTPQPNGLRRDRWRLDKPQASYLAGFAVGEYAAEVENYVRRDGSSVPLAYLVEPANAQNVRLIFGETPAMMRFFEDKIGLAYPWSNYKQAVAYDFTASGMENTTATLLYDDIQHDTRAHLDFTGRDLIVHELAHQWFGDLLTCRNWGNISLNEGFASYFERLYLEEAYGAGAAQAHTIEDRDIYLKQAEDLRRPIIWYGYSDPNEMFDAHSYQKAALALHQLRFELGDQIWWQGIRQYARENAYRSVVIEDLQRAMEQASGRNLSGFFNQWFRRPGHPELEVEHHYVPERGLYEIHVRQVQDSIRIGNFSFEVDIEVNVEGAETWIQRYRIAARDSMYRFAIPGGVSFVRFDAGDWALGDIKVTKDLREWYNQARHDDEMAGRYDAVVALGNYEPQNEIRDILVQVMQTDADPFVRKAAAMRLNRYADQPEVRVFLGNTVRNDQDAGVRREALTALSVVQDEMFLGALRAAIRDPSYQVTAKAVELLAGYFGNQALPELRALYNDTSWNSTVERALIDAYSTLIAIEGIPYLQDHLADRYEDSVQIGSLQAMSRIARFHAEVRDGVVRSILGALDSVKEPVRFEAVRALEPLQNEAVSAEINRRMASESSERVRQAMAMLAGPENE